VGSNSPTPILMSPHEKEDEKEESYLFGNRAKPKNDPTIHQGTINGKSASQVDRASRQPETQSTRDRFDDLVEQYKKVRSPPKPIQPEEAHNSAVGVTDVSHSSRGLSTAALRVRYQSLRAEVDDVQKEFNQLKLQHKRSSSRSRSPRGRGDDGTSGLGAENESAIVEKEMHLKTLESTLAEMKAQYQTQVKEWHNEKKLLEKRLKTISALQSQLEEKSSRSDDIGSVEADSLFVKAADLETLHADVVPLIRDRAKERAEVRRLRNEISLITGQLKELEDEKAENHKYLESSAEYRQAALQGAEDVLAHAQTIREAAFSRQAAREAIAHAATKLKEERMSLTALVNEEQLHYATLEEKQTKEKAQIEVLTQQLTELELDIEGS
jgi:DNA repair exonuclease SbcCD ATPase subunit